jgi:hypothetical protein
MHVSWTVLNRLIGAARATSASLLFRGHHNSAGGQPIAAPSGQIHELSVVSFGDLAASIGFGSETEFRLCKVSSACWSG